MKRPIYYSPFLLIILLPLFYGQTLPVLSCLSVDELEQRSRDKDLPREEQAAYLDALIKKAKQNGDSLRLADAYNYLCSDCVHAYNEQGVAYTDSLIDLTKHWTHKTYPAHAYLQKGYASIPSLLWQRNLALTQQSPLPMHLLKKWAFAPLTLLSSTKKTIK